MFLGRISICFGQPDWLLYDGILRGRRVKNASKIGQYRFFRLKLLKLRLLSPGGTSYDVYDNFAERGEHFRQLVSEL